VKSTGIQVKSKQGAKST